MTPTRPMDAETRIARIESLLEQVLQELRAKKVRASKRSRAVAHRAAGIEENKAVRYQTVSCCALSERR
jgi:hypothetical protein